MRLKYPIRKYLLPWFVGTVSITSLIRLGNHAFLAMAVFSTLVTYGVLKLATKQIEKKDVEIENLKSALLHKKN